MQPPTILLLATTILMGLGPVASPSQAQASAGPVRSFELVYRHDARGQAVHGSLEDLRRAVRAGLEIRVGWAFRHPRQERVSVEHVADASFLTVLSGEHVLAQIEPIGAQAPDFNEGRIRFRDGQLWRMIASTKGEMMSQVSKPDGSTDVQEPRPQGFSWFVRGSIPAASTPLWDDPAPPSGDR